MSGEYNQLSQDIGGLKANVETLTRTVEANQEASTREHRIVHDIVVATSEAVRNLAAVVAEMKPLTDDYREKRAEARGAARMAKIVYATVATGAGMFGAFIMKKLGITV